MTVSNQVIDAFAGAYRSNGHTLKEILIDAARYRWLIENINEFSEMLAHLELDDELNIWHVVPYSKRQIEIQLDGAIRLANFQAKTHE